MGALLWLAAAFLVVWFVLFALVHVAGFAVHLLLFAAALALIIWAVRKASNRTSTV